jgi:hypothetical protein
MSSFDILHTADRWIVRRTDWKTESQQKQSTLLPGQALTAGWLQRQNSRRQELRHKLLQRAGVGLLLLLMLGIIALSGANDFVNTYKLN